MSLRTRLLGDVNASTTEQPDSSASNPSGLDQDFVIILAALLCALICVLGLAAVARCSWFSRISGRAAGRSPAPANKGLKKKVLNSLPTLAYDAAEHAGKFSDCAICLSEFVAGDEIRVLPQCGHGFHVACIDTWLGCHSSCPSCRQICVAASGSRCQKCGGFPASSGPSSGPGAEAGARLDQRRIEDVNTFLP